VAQLRPPLRYVIELRGGAGLPPLPRSAVASRLDMSVARVARLEARAVDTLRRVARHSDCAHTRAASLALSILTGFEPPLGAGAGLAPLQEAGTGARVGVAAFHAGASGQGEHPAGRAQSFPMLPSIMGPRESIEIAILLLVGLAGLLMVGFLFGDELGLALRDRKWVPRRVGHLTVRRARRTRS
jgi:hypothetical protein